MSFFLVLPGPTIFPLLYRERVFMAKKREKVLDDTPATPEFAHAQREDVQEALIAKMKEVHGIPGEDPEIPESIQKKLEYESRRMRELNENGDSARISPFSPLGMDLENDPQTKEALREMDSHMDVPTYFGNLPIGYVYDSIYGHLGQNIPLLLQAILRELLYRRLMRL